MTIGRRKRISRRGQTRNHLEGSIAQVPRQNAGVIKQDGRRRLSPASVSSTEHSNFSLQTKRDLATAVLSQGTGVDAVPVKSTDPSEPLTAIFKARMQKAFGTADEDFISHLFEQAGNALPGGIGPECKSADYFVAALHGIGPRDELEALLAVQMVSVHTLGMEFLKRAAISEQTDLGIEVNVNRANKLLRVFANQVEALSRYRGKGEQKMTVEHVHVYKGGQAIVGPVNQKSCGKRDQHDKIK